MVYRKDENYYPKVFLEKYNFIENRNIFSNSDEEYHYQECINLFLDFLKKKYEFFLNLGL